MRQLAKNAKYGGMCSGSIKRYEKYQKKDAKRNSKCVCRDNSALGFSRPRIKNQLDQLCNSKMICHQNAGFVFQKMNQQWTFKAVRKALQNKTTEVCMVLVEERYIQTYVRGFNFGWQEDGESVGQRNQWKGQTWLS